MFDISRMKLVLTEAVEASILAVCDVPATAANERTIEKLREVILAAQVCENAVAYVDEATTDCDAVWSHFEEFLSHGGEIVYADCEPGWSAIQNYLAEFKAAQKRMRVAVSNALIKVYSNFERELGNLVGDADRVALARTSFETEAKGGGGIPSIEAAHNTFDAQAAKCSAFRLMDFTSAESKKYVANNYYAELKTLVEAERKTSEISELDRIRDEYRSYGRIRVPAPAEFSQQSPSANYSWATLNTGDYSWGIVRPVLLQRLDQISGAMAAAGYQMQINSCYRNPARSDGNSRHQFGDAVDLQVFPVGHPLPIEAGDWKALKAITDQARPSYTEPMSQSGKGHVHVDWRND